MVGKIVDSMYLYPLKSYKRRFRFTSLCFQCSSITKMEDRGDDIITKQALDSRIDYIRQHVARPIPQQPFDDSTPALVPFSNDHGGIIVGSHRHAANIPLLKSMGVVAVSKCTHRTSIFLFIKPSSNELLGDELCLWWNRSPSS